MHGKNMSVKVCQVKKNACVCIVVVAEMHESWLDSQLLGLALTGS